VNESGRSDSPVLFIAEEALYALLNALGSPVRSDSPAGGSSVVL
jgi:hypothetical protein